MMDRVAVIRQYPLAYIVALLLCLRRTVRGTNHCPIARLGVRISLCR